MLNIKRKFHLLTLLVLVLAGLLSACGPQATPTAPVGSETMAVTDAQPAATATATLGAPTVLLVAGPDANPGTVSRVQATLEPLAAESSLALTVVQGLTPDQLTENIRVVIGVGTAVDLNALAPAAPGIQFVAIDQPAAVAGANLSVIGNPLVEEERQSFMGGYLAALVTTDYKVAGLIPSDTLYANETQDAYLIGTRFFCGLCNPKFPPYNTFPQLSTVPAASDAATLQNAVNTLVNLGTEVVYVHADLVTPELLEILSNAGLEVVGGASPDMARNNWVGTVVIDPSPALAALWPDLLAGGPGQQLPGSVTLLDTEAGLVSEGRIRLFEEIKADLEADLVLPETQH